MQTPLRTRKFVFPVELSPAVGGEVCGTVTCREDATPRDAQILVHGATYDSWYWTSYVAAAAAAGYLVVNVDRIGSGRSTRPDDPGVLTTETNAYVVHQVVQALRNGTLGEPAVEDVMLVGHSYGSLVATVAAARYRDIGSLVLTGFAHFLGPGFQRFQESLHPAYEQGGRFANLHPDYLTTRPGTRTTFHTSDTAPDLVAADEECKGTHARAEINTTPDALAASQEVTSRVLLVVGAADSFFDVDQVKAREHEWWRGTTPQVVTVPGAGHSLALGGAADRVNRIAVDWARNGDRSATRP